VAQLWLCAGLELQVSFQGKGVGIYHHHHHHQQQQQQQ
jgi:hypothetical protein